ncbi:SCP-2 sterol transfer family protein [bacterium BMS3Abin05]|nr:SCP-2 sterol transfer family protein [bacterium BMS3Abin05]GBE26244.1 SCP-2 sterol transfer family protein [bacterium BMS3Bbin03]HDZ11668.1 SCP2 sterol-binding domain-containing protein [Bacteroidota bacterium]HDZ12821.1 SCP2 sterol-binding domain-containing protein [Bacteroidota bacterium]
MLLGSNEWWAEAMKIVNSDETYYQLAKNLNKSYTFKVLAEPENGISENIIMGYKIENGKIVDHWEDERPTDFVIAGPYKVWYQILKGKMGPVKAMTMRKLKVKGPLPEMLKYNKATLRWVELLRTIKTEFHGNYE